MVLLTELSELSAFLTVIQVYRPLRELKPVKNTLYMVPIDARGVHVATIGLSRLEPPPFVIKSRLGWDPLNVKYWFDNVLNSNYR